MNKREKQGPGLEISISPFLYGSLGVLISLVDYPLVIIFPTFLSEVVGISLTAIAVGLGVLRVFDTLSDIAIGFYADRFLNSEVKLRLFVAAMVPFLTLAVVVSFNLSAEASVIWVFATLLFLFAARSLVDIPHTSLGALYQGRVAGSSTVMFFGWRSIFQGVGILLIAASVQFAGGANESSLSLIAWVFLISAGLVVLALFKSAGRRKSEAVLRKAISGDVSAWEKWFLFAYFLNQIANAMAATLVIFYIEHVLIMAEFSGLFLGSLFLSTMLSVPFWNFCSKQVQLVPLYKAAILAAIAVFLIVPFLEAGNFGWYLFVCISAGALFGADAVLPPSEIERRKRSEEMSVRTSTVFGLKSMLDKAALMLPIIVALPVIEAFGFDPAPGMSTDSGLLSLVLLYSVVPAGFKVLAVLVLSFSPVSLKVASTGK